MVFPTNLKNSGRTFAARCFTRIRPEDLREWVVPKLFLFRSQNAYCLRDYFNLHRCGTQQLAISVERAGPVGSELHSLNPEPFDSRRSKLPALQQSRQ